MAKSRPLKSSRSTRELQEVQRTFKQWRQANTKRKRIPDELWGAAVSLCQNHSISTVTKLLRLDYRILKQKVSMPSCHRTIDDMTIDVSPYNETIPFLKLSLPGENTSTINATGITCRIEVLNQNGCSLKVALYGKEVAHLREILAVFLQKGV